MKQWTYRILGISFLLCVLFEKINAQQLPIYSQYNLNGFVINPAMTGMDHLMRANATYRRQWGNLPGGPETATASFTTYLEDNNMGLGGYLLWDKTGPTSNAGINLDYSYHIELGNRYHSKKLAFGLALAFYQYRLNGSELLLDEPDDEAAFSNNASKILPDAGLGAVYYTEDFYVGFSVPQSISMNVQFEGVDGISRIRRIAHFYLMAGGKIDIYDSSLILEPSVWIKYAPHSPIHADFNLKATISEFAGVGIGYSTSNIAQFEVDFLIMERARLGYAFSFQFADWQPYLGFNHEILLSFIIDNPKWYNQ